MIARASGAPCLHQQRPGPEPLPRPALPASWVTSAKVRSSARKSGKRSVLVQRRSRPRARHLGKSWPLATIWVPISTPALAAIEPAQACSPAHRFRPEKSASSRSTGKRSLAASTTASSCSSRSMPAPCRETWGHRGAAGATLRQRLTVPAVVARDRTAGTVKDERHLAVRAHPNVAAGSARQEARPATAIQQFTGNLTLAAIDVSSPRNPVLRGTLIPSPAVPTGGAYSVVGIGNGRFAVSVEAPPPSASSTATTIPAPITPGVVGIVDATNPASLVFTQVVSVLNPGELGFSNGFLFVTGANGLNIFKVN